MRFIKGLSTNNVNFGNINSGFEIPVKQLPIQSSCGILKSTNRTHSLRHTMVDETLLPKHPTSLGSWVLLVAQAIDSYGLDSKAIFARENVDLDELKKPNSRISTIKMIEIWRQAIEQSQDPCIALRVAKYFRPTAFSALGMALAASLNAYDALKRAAKYSQIISDGSTTNFEESQDTVAFVITARSPLLAPLNIHGVEGLLASLVNVLRTIAGDDLPIKEVHFQHDGALQQDQFNAYFACPVIFNSTFNKVVFNKQDTLAEQAFANSVLTCTLDEWIENYLQSFKEDLISTKVKKYILKNLAYGELDQQKVARELALSSRMLQRKLKDEGTSYTELLDECRHKLAIKLISQNKLALSEVTYILGFSDQSNFSRAFKRWTGQTPNHYREH